jgi:hypothetical protein
MKLTPISFAGVLQSAVIGVPGNPLGPSATIAAPGRNAQVTLRKNAKMRDLAA